MNATFFKELFDYNAWANNQVLSCVDTLTEEQFKQPLSHSLGPIFIQLFHMMAVESWWFIYLSTGELKFFEDDAVSTREDLRREWKTVAARISDYTSKLTPEELEREVRPEFWEAEKKPIKVWQAMMQVANHSTDHRAQLMAGLHTMGAPTVGQDVLDYLFEKQKSEKNLYS